MKRLYSAAGFPLLAILLTLSAHSQLSQPAPDSAPLARRTAHDGAAVAANPLQFSHLVLSSSARSVASVIRHRIDQRQQSLADLQNAPPAVVDTSIPAPGRSKQFGIGFMASLPTAGVSGIYNLSSRTAVQGLLGMFLGGVKTATGRFLYYFRETTNFQPYAVGELGIWGYDEQMALGIGAGGGMEYFIERYPWVSLNIEFALRMVDFEQNDFNISGFSFGGGVHYYF